MEKSKARIAARKRRAGRVRKKVVGSADRPRLCIARSLRHLSAQIVDDGDHRTLASATSASKEFDKRVAGAEKPLSKTEKSKVVGQMIADVAKERGIAKVVFDRRGYTYHGRIRALADGARGGGLQF